MVQFIIGIAVGVIFSEQVLYIVEQLQVITT